MYDTVTKHGKSGIADSQLIIDSDKRDKTLSVVALKHFPIHGLPHTLKARRYDLQIT